MNTSQKRKLQAVEALIEICNEYGLSSGSLKQVIHEIMHGGSKPGTPTHDHYVALAERVNRAGLMAQLYYMVDIMGARAAAGYLKKTGSQLDGFVKGFATTAEERERDLGRDNVDADGSVLID